MGDYFYVGFIWALYTGVIMHYILSANIPARSGLCYAENWKHDPRKTRLQELDC